MTNIFLTVPINIIGLIRIHMVLTGIIWSGESDGYATFTFILQKEAEKSPTTNAQAFFQDEE
jgi:hypothetical protein